MSLSYASLVSKVTSALKASGQFSAVNGHEPKNAVGKGLTGAVWVDRIRPLAGQSGLNSTSVVVVLMARIYSPMISEPQDAIDPAVVAAADKLMATISADHTLGGTVKKVDLLGSTGFMLEAQAGYVTLGQTLYRVIDVTVPCVVNDLWTQEVA